MPANKMPQIVVGPDHPTYYAELLRAFSRPSDRRNVGQSVCPELPIEDVDDQLVRRLQTLLDTIAMIAIPRKGNVAASTISLSRGEANDNGPFNTHVYVIFDWDESESDRLRCWEHLSSIFNLLKKVPYRGSPGGSPKISQEFKENILEMTAIIHTFSLDVFVRRVQKRKDSLKNIKAIVAAEGQSELSLEERKTIEHFFLSVDQIVGLASSAAVKHELTPVMAEVLDGHHLLWERAGCLRDPLSTNPRPTLLDKVDAFLADHGVGFSLSRWASKIMSFVIATQQLFALTQSRRLHDILQGSFYITILPSQPASPYSCDLTMDKIRQAVNLATRDTVFAETSHSLVRTNFAKKAAKDLLDRNHAHFVERQAPTVHAELAMLAEMDGGKITVFPYIGVSKLCCVMCSHYLTVYRQQTDRPTVSTRGCHGKVYPSWAWPVIDARRDQVIRPAFMSSIKQELFANFRDFVDMSRKGGTQSDSSVGSSSSGPGRSDPTPDLAYLLELDYES